MNEKRLKQVRRHRRKLRVRKGVFGTSERPRLTVFRAHKNITAQIIDDERGVTLCQASTLNKDLRIAFNYGGNRAAAKIVGAELARRAQGVGVQRVAFDRNGYRYHGRVKTLAEAAREGGLQF